ncbi:thiolase family protein [Actinophytocola sp.]|uniref:thiolase family protein n=1 Tax=Actinophytocola sp. TaxID=1872138 RepID=UPI003D6AF971
MTSPGTVMVVGTGETEFTRRSNRSVRELTVDAMSRALADAGLTIGDIDAVIPLGGDVSADDLVSNMGASRCVVDAHPPMGGNSGVAALALAEAIMISGRADTVAIVFARNGSSARRVDSRVGSLPGQHLRTYLERPHGWITPAQWYSVIAKRHEIEFGSSKAAMAEVAVTARRHAQLNPNAMMHRRTLTHDEYYAAPMITDPYQRYDCCLETDGAVALILAIADRAERLPESRPVRLLSAAAARPESPDDLTNREDWFDIGLTLAAPLAYAAAGLGPEDVDVAMVYDCFTFEVLHQLEEAGFCERGGSAELVLSGATRLGGRLPVNTHGGLLAEGHLGGVSHVTEAVRQLRGEAGRRQVDGARIAAVTGWGDWGDGSLALLGSVGHHG